MKASAYILQAALIIAWWIGLTISSNFFDAFQFHQIGPIAFWSFLIPDLTLIAGLSLLRVFHGRTWIEWVVLGAFAYAALFCLNASLLTGSGYLSTVMMILGLAFNLFLCFSESLFRESATRNFWVNLGKTLVQIIVVWGVSLVVIPYLLLDSFGSNWSPSATVTQISGWSLFGLFSLLGLTSSYFMVRDGMGTPLPLDQPQGLVISGPYRWVRNPMAVAGIGQGLSLALIFQSVPLLIYALLGAVVWHIVVRPVEESDLASRFGEPYVEYRNQVYCWLPLAASKRK